MRPNAKINTIRKSKASRKAGGPNLPPVVMSRIQEAGASAYQWRDNVLLSLYLPPTSVQITLKAAFWALQALTATAITLLALQSGPTLALAALAIPLTASAVVLVLRRKLVAPPSVAWVVGSVVGVLPLLQASQSWGLLGALVVLLASLVSAERERPVRGVVSAWVSVVVTLGAGAVFWVSGWGAGVTVGWVLLLLVAQVPVCVVRRSFRTIAHRVSRDDLVAQIPPPEFRWEPLAASVRRAARAVESVPVLSVVASAFSSSSWIEGVIEGPSDAVVGDALKKAAGGYGERKTGVLLLGLARGRGTMILHDVVLPGAQAANIDHIVIGRGRGGKPCAFVIDSKFYGKSRLHGNVPGEVTYDMASGGYVHRVGASARGIDQSIRTAVWGADAVRKVTGIEDVRVVMAIHNADVASSLSFTRGEVAVDIISAWSLVPFIEGKLSSGGSWLDGLLRRGGGPLSPLQEARVAQGFVSASTGQRPAVVSPLGLTAQAREFMAAQAAQARGGYGAPPAQRPRQEPQRPQVPPYAASAFVPPHAQQPTPQAANPPAPRDAFQAADQAFFGTDLSDWADDSPPALPVPLAESAPERIGARWTEMRNSPPAPLDDVAEQHRHIIRGTPLTITSFSETSGPTAMNVIAITGVCSGSPGTQFLWYCSPENWNQYTQTGNPVAISTITVDRVIAQGGR